MKNEWGKIKSSTTERSECCAPNVSPFEHEAQHKVALARLYAVHRHSRTGPRGQISAEFVITLILLFSMFSFIVLISSGQKENINLGKEKIQAKTLLEKTSRAVNGIYLAGNGSTTKINKNIDLNFGIEENSLRVEFGQGQFVSTSL
jgi:hypothetical protein